MTRHGLFRVRAVLAVLALMAAAGVPGVRAAEDVSGAPKVPQAPGAPGAPGVPTEACGNGIVAVAVIDMAKTTPAEIEAAAQAAFGPAAADLLGRQIKQYAALHAQLSKAGVVNLTVAFTAPEAKGLKPAALFLKIRNGASEAEIIKAAGELKVGSPGAWSAAERVGQYLRVGPTGAGVPATGTAEQQKKVQDALASGGEAGIRIAVLANPYFESMKAMTRGFWGPVPGMAELARALTSMNVATVTAGVGHKPVAGLTLTMASAQAAVALVEAWNQAVAEMQKFGLQNGPKSDAAALTAGLKRLNPKIDGTVVSVMLDAESIAQIGGAVGRPMQKAQAVVGQIRSNQNASEICRAIHLYADEHQGRLPPGMDDLKPYMEKKWDEVMTNPVTGRKDRYLYVPPKEATLTEVANPGKTAVVFEADENGKPAESGAVGYLDRHVEYHGPGK